MATMHEITAVTLWLIGSKKGSCSMTSARGVTEAPCAGHNAHQDQRTTS